MNDIILSFDTVSLSLFNSKDFIVDKIENLTWAQNELALTTNPYLAGDNIQMSRGLPRDITITLKPTEGKGDYGDIIHKISRGFNKECTLTWKNRKIPSYTYILGQAHTDANLIEPLTSDLVISGRMNELDSPRFDDGVRIVFNLHCSNPYWQTKNAQTISLPNTSGSVTVKKFCNYSAITTGFKVVIPLFSLNEEGSGNAPEYCNIDFLVGGQWQLVNYYRIQLYATTNVSALGKNLYLSFEEGNISIKQGSTEETATNIADKVGWRVLRSTNGFFDTQLNEIPRVPTSEVDEELRAKISYVGEVTPPADNVITYYPKFL